tara:strand:- start:410 stop:655 length:246 start_codon:yes stop_codon:yes gene_type:complete
MNDKEKLKVIKHYLEETYRDSKDYMNEFYNNCKNDEIEDLEWLVGNEEMDDFINACPIEYIRIYDYALLDLSRRLLKMLDE